MPEISTTAAKPKNWPAEIFYLDAPSYSPGLTPSHTALIRSQPDDALVIPPGIRRGPSPRVRIIPIANPSHPANYQSGLFAAKELRPGSFVLEYLGVFHVSALTVSDLPNNETTPLGIYDEHAHSDYDLSLDREVGLAIDANKMGNEARFVNDYRGVAEKPNAEFKEVWNPTRGERSMSVWVLPVGKSGKGRSIKKGEEILLMSPNSANGMSAFMGAGDLESGYQSIVNTTVQPNEEFSTIGRDYNQILNSAKPVLNWFLSVLALRYSQVLSAKQKCITLTAWDIGVRGVDQGAIEGDPYPTDKCLKYNINANSPFSAPRIFCHQEIASESPECDEIWVSAAFGFLSVLIPVVLMHTLQDMVANLVTALIYTIVFAVCVVSQMVTSYMDTERERWERGVSRVDRWSSYCTATFLFLIPNLLYASNLVGFAVILSDNTLLESVHAWYR